MQIFDFLVCLLNYGGGGKGGPAAVRTENQFTFLLIPLDQHKMSEQRNTISQVIINSA